MTKKQKPKIDDNMQKIAELEDKLVRSLADYANLAKRIEDQKQFFVALASAQIMGKIIEALDDLYLASNHLKDQGLTMALDKLKNALKSEGLEEIDALGKEFDPKFMDCVHTDKGEENKVLSISKKGYLLNGECLRPAQVVVGKK
jgi:molecular chaperone GrpE